MIFDGPVFAAAWLSVAQASAKDKDLLTLNRTVAIEEYTHGVRLVATDRFVLLTAWVPNVDTSNDAEPHISELPDRTVIALDADGRCRNLLGYVLALSARDEDAEVDLRLTFDARLPAGTGGGDVHLDGLAPVFTIFEIPDTERVWCPVVVADFPDWRTMLDGFKPRRTEMLVLNPEFVERIAKVRKWSAGYLHWTFGGRERPAMVDFESSDPHVSGIVMPSRWLAPGEPGPDADDEAQEVIEDGDDQ